MRRKSFTVCDATCTTCYRDGEPDDAHAHPEGERVHADEQGLVAERPGAFREKERMQESEQPVEIQNSPNAER